MKVRALGTMTLVAALALTACGNTGGGSGGASGSAGGNTELEVSAPADGTLAFAPTTLTAPANTAFTVAFDNPSSVEHNFVLVRPGSEDAVATAALPAGEIEKSANENILAAGDLVASGDEDIPVDALPAGTYTYICTFPGHASAMRGTLTVQ